MPNLNVGFLLVIMIVLGTGAGWADSILGNMRNNLTCRMFEVFYTQMAVQQPKSVSDWNNYLYASCYHKNVPTALSPKCMQIFQNPINATPKVIYTEIVTKGYINPQPVKDGGQGSVGYYYFCPCADGQYNVPGDNIGCVSCAAGTWLKHGVSESSFECSACPDGGTSNVGAGAITDCTISNGSDSTGVYVYSPACHYSE